MQVLASNDRKPCDNSHLTWNWQPRAIIHDTVQLHLPPDLPPGPYELTVGMYDTLTGERLAASGAESQLSPNAIVLQQVE